MLTDERDFFTRVYNHAFPVLLRVVFRIVGSQEAAEEICHDAFIRFLERSDRFPDVDQATYWLLRVGKNLAFNYSKRQGRERAAYERTYHEPVSPSESAETPVLRDEATDVVREALQKLPRSLRDVLVLREFGGLDYQEIARILGLSVGNVKVRAHRGRTKLAKILEDYGV